MTLFVGSEQIKQIVVGPYTGITKVYYGRQLVWEVSTILKEDTKVTKNFNLFADGLYEITMTGGGGGGNRQAVNASTNYGQGGTGGSGAAFKGVVYLEHGRYTVSVAGADENTRTILSKESDDLIICNSGTNGSYGGGGAGGTISVNQDLNILSTSVSSNGYNGNWGIAYHTGGAAWVGGQPSLLSSYGISNGGSQGMTVGFHYAGWVTGTNGYFEIKYIGQIPSETLYAYYVAGGFSVTSPDYACGMVIYSPEVFDEYSTLGEKQFYCGLGTNVKDNVFKTIASAKEHPVTGTVTHIYSYGFDLSNTNPNIHGGYHAIRCPNLDIHSDGTVGDGGPNLFCYYSPDGLDYECIYLPLETSAIKDITSPSSLAMGTGETVSTTYSNLSVEYYLQYPRMSEDSLYSDDDPEVVYERYSAGDITFPLTSTFTINPTPSDAIVTLTVDGTVYNQNSISVRNGKTVSWSVSKEGYITQTGSTVVSDDKEENIILEELPLLFYCFKYNSMYFYVKQDETQVGQHTYATQGNHGSKATSASQLEDSGAPQYQAWMQIQSFSEDTLVAVSNGQPGHYSPYTRTCTRSTEDDLYS